jgi:hypothetical protein
MVRGRQNRSCLLACAAVGALFGFGVAGSTVLCSLGKLEPADAAGAAAAAADSVGFCVSKALVFRAEPVTISAVCRAGTLQLLTQQLSC